MMQQPIRAEVIPLTSCSLDTPLCSAGPFPRLSRWRKKPRQLLESSSDWQAWEQSARYQISVTNTETLRGRWEPIYGAFNVSAARPSVVVGFHLKFLVSSSPDTFNSCSCLSSVTFPVHDGLQVIIYFQGSSNWTFASKPPQHSDSTLRFPAGRCTWDPPPGSDWQLWLAGGGWMKVSKQWCRDSWNKYPELGSVLIWAREESSGSTVTIVAVDANVS